MYKRFFCTFLCILGAVSVFAGSGDDSLVIIRGHLPSSYEGSMIRVFFYGPGGRTIDSSIVKDGSFEMRTHTDRAGKGSLILREPGSQMPKEADYRTIYLEPGSTVTVEGKGTWQELSFKGGPIQTDWAELEQTISGVMSQLMALPNKFDKKLPEETRKATEARWNILMGQLHEEQNEFIKAHPASFVSWDVVHERSLQAMDDKVLLVAYDALAPKWKETEEGKATRLRIVGTVNTAIGQKAPDFVAMDTLGNKVTLGSLEGKYLVVDFWASWCGFCRAETPNLKQAYSKYKDKFDIVSVSYDDTKEKWMGAVHEDKMPWQQISELKAIPVAPSAMAYGISGIPQIYLLDPTGKIVARGLRGDALERKLAEIFGVR